MKKLTFTFNAILISLILLSAFFMQGMENHEQLALQAEKYNENNSLCLLPKDVLLPIVSYSIEDYQLHRHYDCGRRRSLDQVDAIEDTIYNFIQFRTICKKFKNLLTIETIGSFCKHYDLDHKNRAVKNLLKKIITTMSDKYENYGHYDEDRLTPTSDKYDNYGCYHEDRRLFALILICAGADPDVIYTEISEKKRSLYEGLLYINSPSLLECATRQSDTQLVKILFEHHADPNEKKLIEYLDHMNMEAIPPVFFHAKTLEIAQIFIDNGVYLHAVDSYYKTNILWKTIENDYPSSLMKLYLDCKATVEGLDSDGNCLLHRLACPLETITNSDNFLQKCELLLNAIPKMINTINEHKNTPLDWAKNSFKEAKEKKATPEKIKAFEKLIKLFKKHGGLSGKKALLKQQKNKKNLYTISHNHF